MLCTFCVVGARDAELREPLPQHVHEGYVSGPDCHAFHVSGCPTGNLVDMFAVFIFYGREK